MKLSEYIAGLKQFMEIHGNMDIYYAGDDEGNSYQAVCHAGSLFYLPEYEKDEWQPALVNAEDKEYLDELIEEDCDFVKVCVVN